MEYLDVRTPQGRPTGEIKAKAAVHRDGDWHLAAHVWILNPAGELLLQRRAAVKENDPDLWDISVAGHVDAGEDARTAAVRELREEIGLTVAPAALQPLFWLREARALKGGRYLDREWHAVFLLRQAVDLAALKLQAEEVAEVRWIAPAEWAAQVSAHSPQLVPHWVEYRALLAYLRATA